MASSAPSSLIRPLVQRLHAYVPGEQPKVEGLIKLNTNENPYPPSPKVLADIKAAVDGRLRLYPNPTSELLRDKLAKFHGCKAENVIVGNGSDELLALAVRAFVEPVGQAQNWMKSRLLGKSCVQYFHPSYSLYPVLAAIHGARTNAVPLNLDFQMPSQKELRRARRWDFQAALTFVTTPNAPTGCGNATTQLQELCAAQKGVVVLDEAYADFAKENAQTLALKFPHVLVARTFSKAYSLCFQRVGYYVGARDLIAALQKIRDSYNVNGLGQIAAMATLDDLPYYQANFRRIIAARQDLSRALAELSFQVFPSQANFIMVRPPHFPAATWLQKLRDRRILVRWFDDPVLRGYLRISIGTPEDVAALVKAAKTILP